MNNDFLAVEKLLPHRHPFLFLDELVSVTEEKIVGKHCFSQDEFFFQGHFPSYPVVPGVILIETMAQCGGAGLRQAGKLGSEALFVLGTVEKAKFRRQVRPGDTAFIEVKNLRVSTHMIRQSGTITVNGDLAAEAQWMCVVSDVAKE